MNYSRCDSGNESVEGLSFQALLHPVVHNFISVKEETLKIFILICGK